MATNVMMVRDGTLHLGPAVTGGVDVDCQVTAATISATPDPKELTTMCGKVTVPGVTAYVLNLDFAQDWHESGISTFLFENDGALVDFTLTPTASTQPTATGKLYVAPGDFGGTVGEIAVATVALGIEGKPTITPATDPVTATASAPAMASAGE